MTIDKQEVGHAHKEHPYIIDLIDRSKNGDDQAFAEIVHLYQNRISYVVNRYISEPSEAMDVCQEVFIKVYRYLDTFKGDSMFYTWLYSVTASVAKNHLNKLQRLNFVMQENESFIDYMDFAVDVHENTNPQDILVSDETLCLLSEAIEELPKLLKEAIILREIEGLSYEKISEILNISTGTVRSRIFRARTIIEEKINGQDGSVLNLHKH